MGAGIGEVELLAYIDDQLDPGSRIEVERLLQDHPEAAARVMAGFGLRDEIRLFLAEEAWPPEHATVGLARELQRRLARRSLGLRARRGLAAAALLAAGWFGLAELDLFIDQVATAHQVPAFADDAAQAFGTMRLKLAAGHAPEPGMMQLPARGRALPVPALGNGLRVLGSDLVPWGGGTAELVLYRAGADELVGLFVAEAGSFAVAAPQAASLHGLPTVYWQVGPIAYAVTGSVPEAELLAIARAAAPRPWAGFDLHPPTEEAING
jgi:anti-sigma factor RsiW